MKKLCKTTACLLLALASALPALSQTEVADTLSDSYRELMQKYINAHLLPGRGV